MWVGKDSKMQDRQLIGRILSINHRKGSAMVEGLNEVSLASFSSSVFSLYSILSTQLFD
jgi:hypothetical protein